LYPVVGARWLRDCEEDEEDAGGENGGCIVSITIVQEFEMSQDGIVAKQLMLSDHLRPCAFLYLGKVVR
jgi:hypothetical protein